jgi:hypothetical protein
MPEHIVQEFLENMLLLDKPGYYGGESLNERRQPVEDKLITWEEFAKNSTKWGTDLK